MKKQQKKRPALSAETLTRLDTGDKVKVAGGVTASCIYTCNHANSCDCP